MKAEVFRENMFSGKTPQGHLDFRLNRTQCKNECRILSHGVSKILRALVGISARKMDTG